MYGEGPTLYDLGLAQLRGLAEALGVPTRDQARLLEVYRDLSASWGPRRLAEPPLWSGTTDDCSPYELSIAFSPAGAELRLVTEAHAEPACAAGYWAASSRLSRALEARWQASLDRVREVEALFEPGPDVYCAALHGAILWPGDAPEFKVYFNPSARGLEHAPALVKQALEQIDAAAIWPALESRLADGASLLFFSLDLTAGSRARIKVYLRLPPATPEGLSAIVARVDPQLATHVREVSSAVYGQVPEHYPRPIVTTYAFRDNAPEPAGITCHFACYPFAGPDRGLAERMARLLGDHGLDAGAYTRAVAALHGPAAPEYGLHNYISMQRGGTGLRLTAYFCPRAYLSRYGALAFDAVRTWPSPVGA
jgi:hypothetical protein